MRLAPKVAGAMLLVAVPGTLAVSALATAKQARTMTAQSRSKGEAIALALAYSLSSNTRDTLAGNVRDLRDLINASKTIEGVSYLYIQDWEGSILAHTFEPHFPAEFTEENLLETGKLRPGERTKVADSVSIALPGRRIWAMDVAAPVAGGRLGMVHVGLDRDSIEREVSQLRRALVGIGFGVAAATVVLGLFLAGAVLVRPIRELTRVTSQIAERGDLTLAIPIASRDEIGELARSFARVVEGLRSINNGLQQSARVLTSSVADLTDSTRAQEETVNRQAAALQQTHVTAQEIRQTSIAAGEKAAAVLQVARRANEISQAGEKAIGETLAGLAELRGQVADVARRISSVAERTRQIVHITDTVKDLADQSNMLALNAAIEAVRAGEHGKGFAVVARQIRSLADESIEATHRVREILQDIAGSIGGAAKIALEGAAKMDLGLEQARASGSNLRELSGIVQDNSDAARQIAEAVTQQSSGITQIFSAVSDLSAMMKDTVGRLQATSAASGSVREVSEEVSRLVESYQA